jgi:hypothetical protein
MSTTSNTHTALAGLGPATHEFFVFRAQSLFVDARAKPAQGAPVGPA